VHATTDKGNEGKDSKPAIPIFEWLHRAQGKLERRMEMTGRRRRRRLQLLDDLKEKRRYWKLKEEVLDRTVWRIRFGRSYETVVRQTAE
jgi:hypothetical protein